MNYERKTQDEEQATQFHIHNFIYIKFNNKL